MESSDILKNAYDYISNSDDVFNVCLVKRFIGDAIVPQYISFQMWLGTSVVMFKLYANDDLKTFKLISDDKVILDKVELSKLFDKIHKLKLRLGDSDITGTRKILDV